jgi:predicted phosphodiesterase
VPDIFYQQNPLLKFKREPLVIHELATDFNKLFSAGIIIITIAHRHKDTIMKIAVLADIHANFAALRAVYDHIRIWKPDFVIVAGDTVNRGPRPSECLSFVLDKVKNDDWRLVRGNHEDYVITWDDPDHRPRGTELEVHRASYWTYQQLDGDVSSLLAMPFQQSLTGPDGREVRIVHASMRGNRDGIYPETSEEELRKKINMHSDAKPPALLCVGHTHRPLIRQHKDILVVNAGSAGLPFDGDQRPSYAQLTWQLDGWHAEIIRIEYNYSNALSDFHTTRYLDDAGPLAELVLMELLEARSQLYQWTVNFQYRVLNGEISMRESVSQYLSTEQSQCSDNYK